MTAGFSLTTPGYNGPLEALLSLIEGQKLAISDISLSEVADAYLAYVERLPELPMGETAQFILIASTLLLIKSRTLLPELVLSVEETASIEDLERRLKRYAIIRKSAKLIGVEWGRAPLFLARRTPVRATVFAPGETSVSALHSALRRLAATLPKAEKRPEANVAPQVALEDVISALRERVSNAFRTRWSELTKRADRHEVIINFLALLELVRSGSASAAQEKLFGDIVIESEETGAPRYGLV